MIAALLAHPAKSVAEAARTAGIPERTAQSAWKLPHVREEVARQVSQFVGNTVFIRAAGVAYELLGDPAISAYVRADLSRHFLACGGIQPARDPQHVNASSIELTILLQNSGRREEVTIDGTAHEIEPAPPLPAPADAAE